MHFTSGLLLKISKVLNKSSRELEQYSCFHVRIFETDYWDDIGLYDVHHVQCKDCGKVLLSEKIR